MAISGGTYSATNNLQQSFKSNMESQNSTVSSVISSYSSSNVSQGGFFNLQTIDNSQNSHEFVGITPEMLSKITTAIDEYIDGLNTTLDGMPTAVDYTSAFRGEGITKAVENFVTSVKDICKSYINSLKQAEQEIVDSVSAHYTSSDSDLASQLNSDASNISGNV